MKRAPGSAACHPERHPSGGETAREAYERVIGG